MSRGHVTGNKREKKGSTDWYRAIEAETLHSLDAEAAAQHAQTDDAQQDAA